jgi:hypothetical protein
MVLIPHNFSCYAAVSPQSPLQNPGQGLRNHFITLGCCFRDTASIDSWEELTDITHSLDEYLVDL